MSRVSFRDRLAPVVYRAGLFSLVVALAFGLIRRWDELTPCPTYVLSTGAVIVIAVGFVANVVTFRRRGILLALVLLIVTSLTVPPQSASRQARNESKAVATIEAIQRAEDALFASTGRRGSIPALVALGLLPRCVSDTSWGYWFEARIGEEGGLTITASPKTNNTGRWEFHKGPDGITRYSEQENMAPSGYANKPVR